MNFRLSIERKSTYLHAVATGRNSVENVSNDRIFLVARASSPLIFLVQSRPRRPGYRRIAF